MQLHELLLPHQLEDPCSAQEPFSLLAAVEVERFARSREDAPHAAAEAWQAQPRLRAGQGASGHALIAAHSCHSVQKRACPP